MEVLGCTLANILSSPPSFLEYVAAAWLLHLLRTVVGYLACKIFSTAQLDTTTDIKKRKFKSNAWYGVYYTVIAGWGFYLLTTVTRWNQLPNICAPVLTTHDAFMAFPSLRVYHVIQLAFYMEYLVAIILEIDVKRRDATAFLLHHVLSLIHI